MKGQKSINWNALRNRKELAMIFEAGKLGKLYNIGRKTKSTVRMEGGDRVIFMAKMTLD